MCSSICVSVAVKISEELEVPESEGDANREGEGLPVRELVAVIEEVAVVVGEGLTVRE